MLLVPKSSIIEAFEYTGDNAQFFVDKWPEWYMIDKKLFYKGFFYDEEWNPCITGTWYGMAEN